MKNITTKVSDIMLKTGFAVILAVTFIFLGFLNETHAEGMMLQFTNGQTIIIAERSYETIYSIQIKGHDLSEEQLIKGNSSDNSVVEVSEYGYITVKKVGEAKITLTFKNRKTKKKTTAYCNIVVKKFSSPFSSLIIDGKKYKMSLQDTYIGIQTKKKAVKIVYKLKDNWKLIKKPGYICERNIKVIKSGSKIKNGIGAILYLKNVKTKEEAFVNIDVYDPEKYY